MWDMVTNKNHQQFSIGEKVTQSIHKIVFTTFLHSDEIKRTHQNSAKSKIKIRYEMCIVYIINTHLILCILFSCEHKFLLLYNKTNNSIICACIHTGKHAPTHNNNKLSPVLYFENNFVKNHQLHAYFYFTVIIHFNVFSRRRVHSCVCPGIFISVQPV